MTEILVVLILLKKQTDVYFLHAHTELGYRDELLLTSHRQNLQLF